MTLRISGNDMAAVAAFPGVAPAESVDSLSHRGSAEALGGTR
jgi:hypothetical protein